MELFLQVMIFIVLFILIINGCNFCYNLGRKLYIKLRCSDFEVIGRALKEKSYIGDISYGDDGENFYLIAKLRCTFRAKKSIRDFLVENYFPRDEIFNTHEDLGVLYSKYTIIEFAGKEDKRNCRSLFSWSDDNIKLKRVSNYSFSKVNHNGKIMGRLTEF